MSRRKASRGRGRPRRTQRVRVHAERRADLDYSALARAVLEQAAMDDRATRKQTLGSPSPDGLDQQVDDEVRP